jgi:hypothetical protein
VKPLTKPPVERAADAKWGAHLARAWKLDPSVV